MAGPVSRPIAAIWQFIGSRLLRKGAQKVISPSVPSERAFVGHGSSAQRVLQPRNGSAVQRSVFQIHDVLPVMLHQRAEFIPASVQHPGKV